MFSRRYYRWPVLAAIALCGATAPLPAVPAPQAPQATLRPRVSPASPSVWEPDYLQLQDLSLQGESEQHFLEAARDFLSREGLSPETLQVELKPLGNPSKRPAEGETRQGRSAGSWRALAEVHV